jgi:hypothetical protein
MRSQLFGNLGKIIPDSRTFLKQEEHFMSMAGEWSQG